MLLLRDSWDFICAAVDHRRAEAETMLRDTVVCVGVRVFFFFFLMVKIPASFPAENVLSRSGCQVMAPWLPANQSGAKLCFFLNVLWFCPFFLPVHKHVHIVIFGKHELYEQKNIYRPIRVIMSMSIIFAL